MKNSCLRLFAKNIEKHIMRLPQQFPSEVLQEAKELLANAPFIEDPDERLRRDLTHLKCYAIDQEGTTEVDDAISIEYIEEEEEEEYDGHEDEVGASKADRTTTGQKKRRRERLWVHIADVSRWIRPGSALSLEAERRMVSASEGYNGLKCMFCCTYCNTHTDTL